MANRNNNESVVKHAPQRAIYSSDRADVAISALCCGASGMVLGWLFGLSRSPVLASAIPILLTVVTAIVSALAGLVDRDPNPHGSEPFDQTAQQPPASTRSVRTVTAVPIAVLMIGIVPGSIIGIYARTNQWFGPDVAALAEQWK